MVCFSFENFERAAAVRGALITHVGLLGCFPSPMGDPQSRGEVWVDPEERLMGSGSFDFLRGKRFSSVGFLVGEHGTLLTGSFDFVTRERFWALVMGFLGSRKFLTSSAWSCVQVTLLYL